MPSESEMRLHRACFTGHRPEKLTQPESEIIAGLEREIKKPMPMESMCSSPAWLVALIFGQRKLFSNSARNIRISDSSVQAPMKVLKKSGVLIGRSDITPFGDQQIYKSSYALASAWVVFRSETSGW